MSEKELTVEEYESNRDEQDPSAAEIIRQVGDFQAAAIEATGQLGDRLTEKAEGANKVTARATRAIQAVVLRRRGGNR